jgi:hypothetical protein
LKVGADKVVYGIVQPRCPHPDGPVRTETIDAMDLMEFADDLVKAAKATEDPNAPLVPGDHCRWCPAAGTPCPALKTMSNDMAASKFKAYTAPNGSVSYDKALLAKTLGELDMIENYCKSVREFAYNEAERGESLPGFKLVAKRATRKWLDAAAVKVWLLSKNLFAKEIETTPELRTPPQIEKLLDPLVKAAAKAAPNKEAAKIVTDAWWADFNNFVKSESSGHTLVSEDDKRPAVKPAAQEVFQVQ